MDNNIKKNLVIRKSTYEDIESIAEVHVKTWQSTYKNILSEEFLRGLETKKEASIKLHQERFYEKKLSTTLVACVENEIVGLCIFGPNRNPQDQEVLTAEIYAIYILESFQKMGIGKALVYEALCRLNNYDRLLIWALEANPWRKFYEKIGGSLTLHKIIEIDHQSLNEVGYYFEDLSNLKKSLSESSHSNG